MDRRLEEMLRAQRGVYERQQHAAAVTAQELAAATGVSGWGVAKVVGVKERDGYLLAVLPACCIVDLDRLKGLIGHGDVRLATVEEIERVTGGLSAGAVPPFGALYGLRTFVDRTLANQPEVTMPAGDFGTSIRTRGTEYLRLARAVLGDFAVPEHVAQSAPRIRAQRDTRPRAVGRRNRRPGRKP